jgi:hypothetical protein
MSGTIQNPAPGQADSAGRRAAVYWFSDGLPEIAFGLIYLVWGVLGMAWRFHVGGYWTFAAMLAAMCGFFVVYVNDRRIVDILKARVTYPRTGYVRPPAIPGSPSGGMAGTATPESRDRNVTLFRDSTVYMFFFAMVIVFWAHGRWGVPVAMTIATVLIHFLSRYEARPYSWWTVSPIALAGWATACLDLPPGSREFLPILIGGVWLLWRGTWTLARYLRAHPRPVALEPGAHE